MTDALLQAPLFDASAFAGRLMPVVQRVGGVRPASRSSGVDAATLSRACRGWPTLSHENYLRLSAWMQTQQEAA